MFLRRWVGSVLRDRYRKRFGLPPALQEMRKMAILETATERVIHERADTPASSLSSLSFSPLPTSSPQGEGGREGVLKSLDDAMEAVRDQFNFAKGSSGTLTLSSSSSVLKVASLTQFLMECRRLRQAIGEARDIHNRFLLREELRRFWAENVDGALACCALQGRDFGFVAGFGLIDDALHMCFSSLQLALHCLAQEKSTCTCMGMLLALHYIARELGYMEKKQRMISTQRSKQRRQKVKEEEGVDMGKTRVDSRDNGTDYTTKEVTTSAKLKEFRRAIATVGMERIHYFFLQRDSSGGVLGSAEDALHALEFLTVVKVNDADEKTRLLVESNKPKWCASNSSYLVTSLFQIIVRNSRDLKFTSIVHAFKLLRIFLPIICPSPPQKRQHSRGDGHISVVPHPPVKTHDATFPFEENMGHREWQRQRDYADRIAWGLCTALHRKDARFLNPFHFVQIMVTLSRLPPHMLSRVPHSKRHALRSLEALVKTSSIESVTLPPISTGATWQVKSTDGGILQRTEEIWEYMIAKACIFIPSLTSSHRRCVCLGLRLAIQKREKYFNCLTYSDGKFSSKPVTAETLLLPLAYELAQYPKDYQAAMFDGLPEEEEGEGEEGCLKNPQDRK